MFTGFCRHNTHRHGAQTHACPTCLSWRLSSQSQRGNEHTEHFQWGGQIRGARRQITASQVYSANAYTTQGRNEKEWKNVQQAGEETGCRVHSLASRFDRGEFMINGFSHRRGIALHFPVTFLPISRLVYPGLVPARGLTPPTPRGTADAKHWAESTCRTMDKSVYEASLGCAVGSYHWTDTRDFWPRGRLSAFTGLGNVAWRCFAMLPKRVWT